MGLVGQPMAKVTVYLLIVAWGVMVPMATWLFLRVDVNEKALALEVKRNAKVRQEMREELEEFREARKGQKGKE